MKLPDVNILHILILSLAVWRWSSLLVDEDGMFGIFEKLRTWVGVRYTKGETGELEQIVPSDLKGIRGAIAKLFVCRWCCSIWLGALSIAVYLLWNSTIWVASIWAVSTLSIIIDAVIGRRYRRRVYFG